MSSVIVGVEPGHLPGDLPYIVRTYSRRKRYQLSRANISIYLRLLAFRTVPLGSPKNPLKPEHFR